MFIVLFTMFMIFIYNSKMNFAILIIILLAIFGDCLPVVPRLKLVLDQEQSSRNTYKSYENVCKYSRYDQSMVCDCKMVLVRLL